MIRVFLGSTATALLLLASVAAQESREIVAEVDGENISAQDLREAAGVSLAKLEDETYRLKQQKLQSLIEQRLLEHEAKRRKVSLESLVETEITAKTPPVTREEILSAYEMYKSRLQKPETEVEEQLRSMLHERKKAARWQQFLSSLRTAADVSVNLLPPASFRASVGSDGPSRGASNAPVTIVEFEDFQCPFCKRAQETVEHVLLRYRDKVRIVHRDLPLTTLHPASWKAHEAARCAEAQGKFWEYRALLYKNAPAAAPQQLNDYASQAGLNVADFKQCFDTAQFSATVRKDEDEANHLGIQGTPVFFINGRLLSGAQPESEFVRVIEEELNHNRATTGQATTGGSASGGK